MRDIAFAVCPAMPIPMTCSLRQTDTRVWVRHALTLCIIALVFSILSWRTASRLARQMKDDADFGAWMPVLMRMVQVSLVGYAVGGAVLSLAYFEVPYYFVGFVVLCDAMVRRRAHREKAAASASPGRGGAGLLRPNHPRAVQ